MTKHTPGPWEAKKLYRDRQHIIRAFGFEVWTDNYSVVTEGTGMAPIRKEADAHLITAAPDLLEACKLGLEWLSAECDPIYQNATPLGLATLEQMQAAIAKAEGREL